MRIEQNSLLNVRYFFLVFAILNLKRRRMNAKFWQRRFQFLCIREHTALLLLSLLFTHTN